MPVENEDACIEYAFITAMCQLEIIRKRNIQIPSMKTHKTHIIS